MTPDELRDRMRSIVGEWLSETYDDDIWCQEEIDDLAQRMCAIFAELIERSGPVADDDGRV